MKKKTIQKIIKGDKVERAITKYRALKKSPILLSQYWKIWWAPQIISHFWGNQ